MEDLFAYLERDLATDVATTPATPPVPPLEHVAELANADWPEEAAGVELARTCDRLDLLWVQHLLLNSLMRNDSFDPRRIRMARIVARALGRE